MAGTEIPYRLKIGSSARNNFVAAVELVNKQVNDQFGVSKPREQWTLEEFQEAMKELPKIQNLLVRKIKKAQNVEAEG